LRISAAGLAGLSAPGVHAATDDDKLTNPGRIRDGKEHPAKDPYGIENGIAQLPAWDGATSSASVPGSMRMFRGNLTHSYYGSGSLPEQPRLVWKFRMSDLITTRHDEPFTWRGTGWTGQALKHGAYVFVASTGGHLHCFEALTGKMVWVYSGGKMFKGSPTLYKNRIYVPNVDNRLRCIDASDGKLLWSWAGNNDIDSSPRIFEDKVYLGGEDGDLKCFDSESGELQWKQSFGVGKGELLGSGGIESSLAIADGIGYFGHLDGHVRAVSLADQALLWKTHIGQDIDASCLLLGDKLYVGVEAGPATFHCLDRATGKSLWNKAIPKGVWSSAAHFGKTVIVGGNNGILYCLDAATGAEVWAYQSGGGIWSSPSVVDGKVMFGSCDRYYRMLDAKTGTELWKYDVGARSHSGAAIEDGHIWVGGASGYFYCFGA
jgi:outer membrane protein assembly factor BamB